MQHLAQRRVREHCLHQFRFGGLQRLADDIAVDQFGDFRAHHMRAQKLAGLGIEDRLDEHLTEEAGVRLCIHPDDPPFPVLGMPRIVGSYDDLEWICKAVDSPANGITFCTGSLSVRRENDLVKIVENLGDRIHFTHLRNNQFSENGCFYESGHLDGNVPMPAVVEALLLEQHRRRKAGRKDYQIPFRPDHGIKMLNDFNESANPGYPLIGRMRGLAEIRGLIQGIEYGIKDKLTD